MMKTIAIVSQKGGAGKTTLAVHIATAAEAAGIPAVLLDMDPQGTAEEWSEWRKLDTPAVLAAKANTLGRTIERAAANGAGLVVIDTPPLAQAEAAEAVKLADLILIPSRVASFDLHAVKLTANLAKSSGKPAFVIFNAGPARGSTAYAEAAEIVKMIGLDVAPVRMSERATIRQAVGDGRTAQEIEPAGRAAAEVAEVWQWIADCLKVKSRNQHYKKKVTA